MFKRVTSLILAIGVFMSLFAMVPVSLPVSAAETTFKYDKTVHWGVENDIWSFEWAPADTQNFSPMTFTTVDGQGECYVADWSTYPYCCARNGGINLHPHTDADSARVFTAPYTGNVTITISIARVFAYNDRKCSPTSFRVLLNRATIYPATEQYRIITSNTAEQITVNAFVKKGEKIRFVVGAIGNNSSDAVNMQTTVKYTSTTTSTATRARVGETFQYSKTASTFGNADTYWAWEWTPAGKTSYSPMTYQYISAYGKNMYASDWSARPYNYVDLNGVKVHPAVNADTVKTFTAPYTGTMEFFTSIARYNNVPNSTANGTSLRIMVNGTQVYPLYSKQLVLESNAVKDFSVTLSVTKGDKVRVIIGSMGQADQDAVRMYNVVTYTDMTAPAICHSDSYSFAPTEAQYAAGDMGPWSFEYHDANDTFGKLTYQYSDLYKCNIYCSDWEKYPYNYVDKGGYKLHPNVTRDTVRTFTVSYDGYVSLSTRIYRESAVPSGETGSSLRIYRNNQQIWPTNGSYQALTSTTETTYTVNTEVRAGDKIRFIIGSMGDATKDAVRMYNTITYRDVGIRELVAICDQYNKRIDVIDIRGDNLREAERVWSWTPTEALGFTSLSSFTYPGEAKIRYSSTLKKYVLVVIASHGFMGVIDVATGKKIWQVSESTAPNPHSIEYLPNGNVAVAASTAGWVRIYAASQGGSNSTYAQANLQGAHGVIWDTSRKILWAVGDYYLTAYQIGGTAKNPTITELTQYKVSLPTSGGHDLTPVLGQPNKLWVSVNNNCYQFDTTTLKFTTSYDKSAFVNHTNIKGIASFPQTGTVAFVHPNGTYKEWNSDKFFVVSSENGKLFGATHRHATGAYYKIRAWVPLYMGDSLPVTAPTVTYPVTAATTKATTKVTTKATTKVTTKATTKVTTKATTMVTTKATTMVTTKATTMVTTKATTKATTAVPTTVKPTTISATTAKATTVKVTTVKATTAAVTTARQSTAATTVRFTTAAATTAKPTTVTTVPVTKPASAKVETDKNTYLVGETVVFTCDGSGTNNTLTIWFPDQSSNSIAGVGSNYRLTVTEPGSYYATLLSVNSAGSAQSEMISFTVTSPTKPTTVPSTQATVAPSNQSTTKSTVNPTVKPSVKPTTVPTFVPKFLALSTDKLSYEVGESATFAVVNIGNNNVTLVLTCPDGSTQRVQCTKDTYNADFTMPGTYTAYLESGNVKSDIVSFAVSEPSTQPTTQPATYPTVPGSADQSGFPMWMLYLMLGLVIVAVILVLVLLMAKKKKKDD